jgi:hypothetical protein
VGSLEHQRAEAPISCSVGPQERLIQIEAGPLCFGRPASPALATRKSLGAEKNLYAAKKSNDFWDSQTALNA